MMKKKLAVLVLALCVAGAVLSGCGQTEAGESGRQPENQTEIQAPASQPEQEENSAESPAEGGVETSKEANVFTGWLPAGVEQVMAETEANPELEQAIIDYYEIPEESWGTTKYYYNYVDLNGDGKEEILAVVMGPYTSGSGGSSLLWVLPHADMAVNQAFTLINTPIIVTKEATNGQEFGAKGLIVQRSGGGGETEFVLLTCSDGIYKGAGDGEVLDSLDGVEGTAIICNDLIADMENGDYLTLEKVSSAS
ncbi:hypothetical protein [uncultured Oscillibacter sp.]|uniref:hypothetical protein n=1 Tax=uncultured Oscillibacter sp. TaxID=876091 RepID=UPI0026242E56|nr:hypothetical protein [uncultured Oscillibacter sp.]